MKEIFVVQKHIRRGLRWVLKSCIELSWFLFSVVTWVRDFFFLLFLILTGIQNVSYLIFHFHGWPVFWNNRRNLTFQRARACSYRSLQRGLGWMFFFTRRNCFPSDSSQNNSQRSLHSTTYRNCCTDAITPQPPVEVRESSVFSSSVPGSLKDIDSSDLCVTALPLAKVHRASCSMLRCTANFPRLGTPGY